jgi:2'-5' RNA ligase
MQAVITVLDDQHCRAVQDIWGELEQDFGIRGTSVHVPIPHVTYQGAEAYDRDRMEGILQRIARETSSFTIETDGLGIFTGPTPVLYMPVVRSPALTQLHQRVWQAITDVGMGTLLVYAPEHWIPHITLAQGDVTSTELAAITRRFGDRRLQWRIPLTNLALITSDESEDAIYSVSFRVESGT